MSATVWLFLGLAAAAGLLLWAFRPWDPTHAPWRARRRP
jgi:hypothetical protein